VPTADPRYGVIVTSVESRALNVLGVTEYIDYTMATGGVPTGKRKILYVSSVSPVRVLEIQQAAAAAPGSVWYVLGEPNAHGKSVEDVVAGLHDTYAVIKQSDPTALITSPSILNFGFSCIFCRGYPTGGGWINEFRKQYVEIYDVEPPIDIWAIDVFPIVWPNPDPDAHPTVSEAFPTVRDDIVIDQIEEYRAWIDLYPASRGKPIWITEFGLHWGYSDWDTDAPGCDTPAPAGVYETEEVKQYLREVYTWLEQNADEMNIERWFTFATYRDLAACQSDSANGLSLFDSPGPNGNLTDMGQFFKDWIHGVR
jgi:hypothetical protein